MKTEKYRTIDSVSKGMYKEKSSKFIAMVIPVCNEKEIKAHLKSIKTQNKEASHHCYAYIIGTQNKISKLNDDGEPSGSAGRPIYGQLESFKLTNVLLIVTRYFGGTKLGIPGLISAYKAAALDALQNATIIEKKIQNYYEILFDYALLKNVQHILIKEKIDIIEQKFDDKCSIKLAVQKSNENDILNQFKQTLNLSLKKIIF